MCGAMLFFVAVGVGLYYMYSAPAAADVAERTAEADPLMSAAPAGGDEQGAQGAERAAAGGEA